jgi:hypothetical protein
MYMRPNTCEGLSNLHGQGYHRFLPCIALLAAILNNKLNIKFLHKSKGTLNLINGGFKYVYHLAF